MLNIAFLNRSTVLSDDQAHTIAHSVGLQLAREFNTAWNIPTHCSFVGKNATTGWQGRANILFLDTSDEAGALGYHDLTPEGLPLGKVFAATDLKYGAEVSVTTSHEATELALDPYVNLTAFDPRRNVFVAYEAADAVEADELGYRDRSGVLLSDFVLPAFFDPSAANRPGARYSYRENVHLPFQLAPGGYESVYVPGRGWTQNTARTDGAEVADRAKVGSRRERRATMYETGVLLEAVTYAPGTGLKRSVA